ncbi:CHAT domain-containing protein [Kitasatospora sp. NPDC057015]|uniref:CHAT domain-containing protein n=1 Tax=Kitasatospora sp. NPDC057015 TaxID=3346001 RepID=UPI003642C114
MGEGGPAHAGQGITERVGRLLRRIGRGRRSGPQKAVAELIRTGEHPLELHWFVNAVYEATSWVGTRQLILDHPHLVGPEAIALIGRYEDIAAAHGDEDSRARFVNHRRLLQGTIDADVDIALGDATPLKDDAGLRADLRWYGELLQQMLDLPRWIDRRWMMEAQPYLMLGTVAEYAEVLAEDQPDRRTADRLRTVARMLGRAQETDPARAVLEEVAGLLFAQDLTSPAVPDEAHTTMLIGAAVTEYLPLVEEEADAVLAELVDETADTGARQRAEGWLRALRAYRGENPMFGRDRMIVLRAIDRVDELRGLTLVEDIVAHITEHPVLLEEAVRAYVRTELRGETPGDRIRWQLLARLLDRAAETGPLLAVRETALRDWSEGLLAMSAFVIARTGSEEDALFTGFPGLGSDAVREALEALADADPTGRTGQRARRLAAFRAGHRQATEGMWEGDGLSQAAFHQLTDYFQDSPGDAGLDEDVRLAALMEVALRLAPADAPRHLVDLTRARLIHRYLDIAESAHTDLALDRAVELHRVMADISPDPDHALWHRSLALVLARRAAHREGDGRDREEAVAAMKRALELNTDPGRRGGWLGELIDIATSGEAAGYRTETLRAAQEALTELTAADRDTTAADENRTAADQDTTGADQDSTASAETPSGPDTETPPDPDAAEGGQEPTEAELLDLRAWALLIYAIRFGDPTRVAEQVDAAQEIPGHSGHWVVLLDAVTDAYHRHPDEELWQLLRRVATTTEGIVAENVEEGYPEAVRPLRAARVRMLLARAARAPKEAALDQALALLAEPGTDPEDDLPLERARLLMLRTGRGDGTPDGLDEVIGLLRAVRQDDPAHGAVLAEALALKHELTGDVDLLDEAILVADRAAQRAGRPLETRDALAVLHRRRYLHLGRLADLETAAALLAEAIDTEPGSYAHTRALGTLGGVHLDRFDATGDATDLDTAIRHLDTGRRQTRPGTNALPNLLADLAAALSTRASLPDRGDRADQDLAQAREAAELAVALTPEGSSRRPRRLVGLAGVEQARAAHHRSVPHARTAVAHLQRALEATGSDSPFRSGYQAALARALLLEARLTDDGTAAEAVAEAAFAQAREALGERPDWSPRTAVRLAGQVGRELAARGRWTEAAETLTVGAAARRLLVQGQPLRRQRETWLRADGDLPLLAAFATARAGDPAGAVALVEQARATELTRVLDLRPRQLEEARSQGHDDLVRRWNRLTLRLNRMGTEHTGAFGDVSAPDTRQVPALVRELEELGAALERAAAPTRPEHPAPAEDVTRVHLLATEWGGLALIVRGPGGPAATEAVPLPGLTASWVTGAATALGRTTPPHTGRILPALLAELGRRATGPVLDALAGDDRPVVFLTGGRLALLPLHAATLPGRPGTAGLDAADIRHAPNTRVLASATATARGRTDDEVLAVGAQGGAPHLRYAAVEARLAAAALGRGRVLDGADARTDDAADTLLTALGRGTVVHFAGHARAVPEDPLTSALLLTGGDTLTMAELLGRRLRARLVVMSACGTGVVGRDLPDEVIGFPAALLQAGVAGVIATLWPVPDDACLLLMLDFYEGLRASLTPPEALRAAQRRLRDTTAGRLRARLAETRASGTAWPPPDVLDGCTEAVAFHEPEERPYAAPENWAAFVYIGA